MHQINGIGLDGRPENFRSIHGALAVATGGIPGDPDIAVTRQPLTGSYANTGDAIKMDGVTTLGIKVEAFPYNSEDVILKVMGMYSSTDTPFEIDALSTKTLWSGSVASFETKYFEFETGVLPYVIPQIIAGTVGTITEAFMTGGGAATSVIGTWNAITDGEFTISVDDVAYDVTGLDFALAVDMDAVATIIETALNTLSGGSETVVWSTDHFIITSAIDVYPSAVSVTSAVSGGTGTDISGAGATAFMDSDTGNGVVTDAELAGEITLTLIKG